MPFTTIVCGVEHESGGERPVAVAAELARDLGAQLVIAHVASSDPLAVRHPPAGGGLAPPVSGSSPTAAESAPAGDPLQEAAAHLERLSARHAGGDAEVEIVVDGGTADGLRRVARERGAQLLVVGSRGRGTVGAALLGSTSHALAGEAPCPVVVVSPEAAA